MLAKNLPSLASELPTRPLQVRPTGGSLQPVAPARTHLLLVHSPSPTARSLAWARRGNAQPLDAAALQSMLRLERLNLG